MSALPTPADVPGGHAVRVLVFRQFHYSPCMSPVEAQRLADGLAEQVAKVGGTYGLVPFELAGGSRTHLRARSVVDIAHGPLSVLRAHEPSQVHVHLHLGAGDPTAAELAAEAAAGVIPTPLALAGRGQRR